MRSCVQFMTCGAILLASCTGGPEFPSGNGSFEPTGIIQAIRLSNASVTPVSGEGRGTGPSYNAPAAAALDASRSRLLVLNDFADFIVQEPWALYAVDLPSGDRTIVSDETHGIGPLPMQGTIEAGAMAFDPTSYRVYVAWGAYLVEVDLATGDRVEVSGPNVGGGPLFETARAVALDMANGRAFLADPLADVIVAVDLTTGDRTVLVDGIGGGTYSSGLTSVALDAANNRLLVADDATDSIYAVDPTTGDVVPFSGVARGTGAPFLVPRDLAVDSARNRVLVADDESLISVDLSSGNRVALKTFEMGLRALALDETNDRVLVAGVR